MTQGKALPQAPLLSEGRVGVSSKPLFIPLKREFFEAFGAGTKRVEYRPFGRRWNERTCAIGREVVLSLGYGTGSRLKGVVTGFTVSDEPTRSDAWKACYGAKHAGSPAACIEIAVQVPFERVLAVLKAIRFKEAFQEEAVIEERTAAHLRAAGIPCETQVVCTQTRCRFDIVVDGDILIEVKKRRPDTAAIEAQMTRYAKTGRFRAMVVLLERSVLLPTEIEGVPCRVVSLRSQWGITV